MKTMVIALLLLLAANAGAAPTADAILLSVPNRILAFHAKNTFPNPNLPHDIMTQKWNYARFLESLIEEVDRDATGGDALNAEQIRSIATYAQVTVIVRESFVPSSTRNTTEFALLQVDAITAAYENVLKDLVPSIGKHLPLYRNTENSWNSAKEAAWLDLFQKAIAAKPATPVAPANISQPGTTNIVQPAAVKALTR